jgi:hypothetical protein
VPKKNGAEWKNIMTSPMHLEYTTHMRDVDVADQLRAFYSTRNRTHKWWHQIFFPPPQYDNGKYVHHLPCRVQKAVKTTSYSFAVQGGVICNSSAMEIYKKPRLLSAERLFLPGCSGPGIALNATTNTCASRKGATKSTMITFIE